MAGLVPAIHAETLLQRLNFMDSGNGNPPVLMDMKIIPHGSKVNRVDGRDKPGHDV